MLLPSRTEEFDLEAEPRSVCDSGGASVFFVSFVQKFCLSKCSKCSSEGEARTYSYL